MFFSRNTKFIALIILISAPALLKAEDSKLTLQQLIAVALGNNPQIQAAESSHRAALARPSQTKSLPDPVLSFVSRNGSGNPAPFTELGKDPLSSVGLMWEQELPYPGKLKLAGRISQKEAESAGADVERVKWTVLAELKQAFYDYSRTHRTIGILNDSRDLLKRFESIAEARYSVGSAIQQDVLRAQVEISIVDQRLTRMQQQKASAVARINQILNRPIDATLPDPEEIRPSKLGVTFENLQAEYFAKAPQIEVARAMLDREKLGLELAKKQYRPDFISSVEYANSPNFPDMWEIQIGVKLPIFYKTKQKYGEMEAAQNLNRAQKELTAMNQEVAFNIRNECLQIQSSEKLLALYQEAIIPQSGLAMESGIASYQVGKADFLTTLSNFLTVLEYRMNYFEELAAHESAIARLEQALGRPLAANTQTGAQNHE